MVTINERDITQIFIGKKVSENFSKVFRQNNDRYVVRCSDLKGNFGITDTLLERWGYAGIDFDVTLSLTDGAIESIAINKCRYVACGHGRPAVRVLKPSQQELRIAKRILEFVIM